MSRHDIFPMGALAVLGALEGKTAEEMAQSLLDQEEEMAREKKEVKHEECKRDPGRKEKEQ